MSPDMALAITAGVGVPVLLAAAPGLWHFHKWLSRVESSLLTVETRSRQLETNGGSHVADVPAAAQRIEAELVRVRKESAASAASARESADLAVGTAALAVQAVERVAGDVRNVQQMITLHLAAGHKDHVPGDK